MSNKTRKRLLPVSLVMVAAIVGIAAAFLMVASSPSSTQAHDGASGSTHCDDLDQFGQLLHDSLNDHTCAEGQASTPTPPPTMTEPDPEAPPAEVTSSSTSASSTVELKLTIDKLPMAVAVGGSIVLYLEDDFAEPDDISANAAYFVVSEPRDVKTGNGARVYTDIDPVISTNDYFDPDKDDIAIQVFVPDMCTNATDDCEGDQGLNMNDTVSLVLTKRAGIKNPSEEGTHSTGYNVLASDHTGSVPSSPMKTDILNTFAKIGLSDVDNKRGYEMTVTGTGFNDGTTAGVYVLANAKSAHEAWWDSLDCAQMQAAMDYTAENADDHKFCGFFDTMGDTRPALSDDDAKYVNYAHLCARIINNGTNVGGALVGSDDKVAVTFEVTAPTFKPGNVNYLCMKDGEGRTSNRDVEDFNLEPSIKVVPSSVATGDTVNVFAQDFQNVGQSWTQLKIAGSTMAPNRAMLSSFVTDRESISATGEGSVTFKVPGGYEGVLRIDARWGMPDGDPAKCDIDAPNPCISKNSKITIAGAELNASKTDVLPNETVTITGNGFGVKTCIDPDDITIDDVGVMVHDDSLSDGPNCGGMVEVSNSGQFVATIILWPEGDGTNPALIPGTHELAVEDSDEFGASVSLTIAEPSITVAPDVAGPRDYITITGENWPVDNLDNSLSDPITVVVEDYQNGRTYPLYADSVGRISAEHRIHRKVAIPDTVQVKANYDDGKIVKIGSFKVPASTITVTPNEGQPGDMVTLTAGNMPVYTEADYVEIGGTTYQDPGVNTDRDGNITVEDVLIPGLDPGVYSVVINVDGTIAIGEVNVLAESSAAGAPAELPGAVENLGDSLVAIFHFDDVGKVWSFYDPRPEFAELNTLTEMVNGEAYWILVSETVEDVVLNNKVRSLTCRGDDCWNLEVW